MKKIIPFFLLVVAGIMLLFIEPSYAQGCSQCRLAPGSNLDGGGHVARNINLGILYLMAVPYMALMFIFGYLYRKPLRARWEIIKSKFLSTGANTPA